MGLSKFLKNDTPPIAPKTAGIPPPTSIIFVKRVSKAVPLSITPLKIFESIAVVDKVWN